MIILVVVVVLALLAYVLLERTQRRLQASLGMPGGEMVAADDSVLGCPTLRSDRVGLVGRPDHLLHSGGHVPMEQKPRARRIQPWHVMQVAAQCLLVQEVYGVRPPYGVVVLAGGVQHEIPFILELEQHVIQTVGQMRELLAADADPGPNWVAASAGPAGFAATCWEWSARQRVVAFVRADTRQAALGAGRHIHSAPQPNDPERSTAASE